VSGPVYVLGGYQTDFARAWAREGLGLGDLVRETLLGALAAVALEPRDVEVVHVGNFIGELMTGQGHLGGLVVEAHPELAGVPTSRHEAACASGSVAALAACADLEAGRYEVACVLGVELLRNLPGSDAARHLGAAAWVPRETDGVPLPWPHLFSELGAEYERRYGLERRHLVALARMAFDNARRNPNAQTRRWALDDASFSDDEAKNPTYSGWIRKHDSSQLTDGGAAVVLASPRFARAWAARTGRPLARVEGWGHRTARMPMRAKLEATRGEPYVFPVARACFEDALRRAGLAGPEALDALEVHDCFTTTAYMAIDHLGLTPPGQSHLAIDDGTIAFGGRLPMNPSGGLIGLGHPVGATGVRMLLDAQKQVTGTAGDYGVRGARRVATFNVGGSVTTTACFIVGSAAA
jgi:acetyl-CoA C-acetyltransferase